MGWAGRRPKCPGSTAQGEGRGAPTSRRYFGSVPHGVGSLSWSTVEYGRSLGEGRRGDGALGQRERVGHPALRGGGALCVPVANEALRKSGPRCKSSSRERSSSAIAEQLPTYERARRRRKAPRGRERNAALHCTNSLERPRIVPRRFRDPWLGGQQLSHAFGLPFAFCRSLPPQSIFQAFVINTFKSTILLHLLVVAPTLPGKFCYIPSSLAMLP